MNPDILYQMFATTLSNMDEKELEESLVKAKKLLSASDYEKLVSFIHQEKAKQA